MEEVVKEVPVEEEMLEDEDEEEVEEEAVEEVEETEKDEEEKKNEWVTMVHEFHHKCYLVQQGFTFHEIQKRLRKDQKHRVE